MMLPNPPRRPLDTSMMTIEEIVRRMITRRSGRKKAGQPPQNLSRSTVICLLKDLSYGGEAVFQSIPHKTLEDGSSGWAEAAAFINQARGEYENMPADVDAAFEEAIQRGFSIESCLHKVEMYRTMHGCTQTYLMAACCLIRDKDGDVLALRGNDMNALRIVTSVVPSREDTSCNYCIVNPTRPVTFVINRHKTLSLYGGLTREIPPGQLATDIRYFVATARQVEEGGGGGEGVRYLFESSPGKPLMYHAMLLKAMREVYRHPKLTTNWLRRLTSIHAICRSKMGGDPAALARCAKKEGHTPQTAASSYASKALLPPSSSATAASAPSSPVVDVDGSSPPLPPAPPQQPPTNQQRLDWAMAMSTRFPDDSRFVKLVHMYTDLVLATQ